MLSTIRRIGSDGARLRAGFRRLAAAASLVGLAAAVLFSGIGIAGQERYDYDPIGRLIRFTDSNNVVTDYTYDKAGNITSVVRGATDSNLPPVLAGITPSVIRLGQSATVTLTGQRLQVGTLQVSDSGLDLSNLRQTATQVQADLSVASSVPTGTQTLTFANGEGRTSIGLLIAPPLPTLTVEPSPLALPPDNTTRSITLRLSNADLVSHQLTLSTSDTSKATVSPATTTLPAGQTTMQVSITPKAAGFVNLSITSPTLKPVSVPVFVTSDFRGVNTSYAMPLGVRVGDVEVSTPPSTAATFKVNAVGVVLGPVLTGVAPRGVAVGGTYTFTISGAAIPSAAQVSLVRPEGVTVSDVVANGSQITVTLAIEPTAAAGPRRFVVKDATGNVIPFADASAATVQVTTGQPGILSIDPLFTTQGKIMQLHLRGSNLQNAQVRLLPAVDLAVDNTPSISSDGTDLTVRVSIAPLAATGPRTVQIVTPSGDTGTDPTAANQFTIVSQIKNDITPIFALPIGLQVGPTTSVPDVTTTGPFTGGAVGVVVGPAAHDATPKVAVVGDSATLTVQGTGLDAVTLATVQPLDGITYGALSVNADGTALSLPITVDPSAARGMRRVVLQTATGRLVFTNPSGDQVLVATPAPELTWVKPQVVQTGKTTAMTILGRNFNDITGVTFDPPTGLTAVGPFVSSSGSTVLTFSIQAAPGAPSGTRTVLVNTAGGTSSAVAAAANTFQLANQVGPTLDSIFAVPVGVTVGTPAVDPGVPTGIYAPNVGVVLTVPVTDVTENRGVYANNVGVLVGPATNGLSPRSPDGLLKGATGVVTITGYGLADVTAASVPGPQGLTVGAVQASSDGTQLSVPVTVPANAPSTYYGITLVKSSGATATRLSGLDEPNMFFRIGSLPTSIDSVSPIVLEQGKTYSFTLRGSNLGDVYQVVAEPAAGLAFGENGQVPQYGTDTFGEKLTVQVRVLSDAPVGSRVVRFKVPGGITSADPTPANTITVVTPQ